jgi:carboxymethylenebutenolidase
MCDDFIHQGLTHDPTVSRRGFSFAAAATAVALYAPDAVAQTKVVETDVNVPMASGVSDSALFYPEGKGKWPAVLVWTDILGLRPVFRELGQRIAAQGYVVLVPNPFYRNAKAPVVGSTFDFSKPEDRAKVMPLAAAPTADSSISDAKSYVAFLDAHPQTDRKKKMGVLGYCMGGPLTFRTAATAADRVGAAATFHGGGLVIHALLKAGLELAHPRRQIEVEVRRQQTESLIGPRQRDLVEVLPHLPGESAQFIEFVGAAQQLLVVPAWALVSSMLVGNVAADLAVVFDGRPNADMDGGEHCTFGNH